MVQVPHPHELVDLKPLLVGNRNGGRVHPAAILSEEAVAMMYAERDALPITQDHQVARALKHRGIPLPAGYIEPLPLSTSHT